jgi:Uma2 family endonuclease
MASKPARRSATYEDLLGVPEHLVAEIIDGELVTSPRPAARHAVAASNLGVEIGGRFGRRGGDGPGGWLILDEPEIHVVGQVLVPDLAGWRRARMPELPDVAHFELRPDWICEVVSPSTAARDRTRKADHYARAGVEWLWLLDPGPRTLEILQLDDTATWRRVGSFAGDGAVRAAPFDAIELDLGLLWDLPR